MIHLDDWKHIEVKLHDKIRRNRLYYCTCNQCGADRGYKPKNYKAPLCNSCAQLNTAISDATRQKQSLSAIRRYNDPTWQPQHKTKKGHHRNKNRKYTNTITPLQFHIKHNMRGLIRSKLKSRNIKKNGNRTIDILGYSINDLIVHLESRFLPEMNWDNYGKNGWEIDHIIPDSWFKYDSVSDIEFINSWSLTNLQPMWKTDNASKGNRWTT